MQPCSLPISSFRPADSFFKTNGALVDGQVGHFEDFVS